MVELPSPVEDHQRGYSVLEHGEPRWHSELGKEAVAAQDVSKADSISHKPSKLAKAKFRCSWPGCSKAYTRNFNLQGVL